MVTPRSGKNRSVSAPRQAAESRQWVGGFMTVTLAQHTQCANTLTYAQPWCKVIGSNEGDPLHTVTITDTTLDWPQKVSFNSRVEAHEYARTIKTRWPDAQVIVTDQDDGVVELRTNGWSRVRA